MTDELDAKTKQRIDAMTHEEMARHYRFAPPGDELFIGGEVAKYFDLRFNRLGGMTPQISKKIGWEEL